MGKNDGFDRWRVLVAPLNDAHFVGDGGLELGHSFSNTPDHGPEVETITSETSEGVVG
jgi:hypothetical protein